MAAFAEAQRQEVEQHSLFFSTTKFELMGIEWGSGWCGTFLSGSTSLQGVALDRLAPTNVSLEGKGQMEGTALPFKLSTWRQHTPLRPGHRHMVTAGEMEIKFLAGEPRSP